MRIEDPFQNIFGVVRIAIDKIKELEQRGQIYGLSRFLPNSIIVMKTIDYPLIVDLYIPGFTFYFQFSIIQDQQTKQIFIDDFRVVYPQPYAKQINSTANFELSEEENEDE
ncbi:hypothetical protein SIRV1gp24 [Sulfolobus islandicus rod-shaped virus 1]|uniref:Uncharacterized protein 110 n=1 Tax=Sulfolobus islandicus rod-shaped virus 1 TaxID=157898 RepID=Y110_SIRV1|nr:hypothetical protein SIRV1gp24 [Sulfolobus islandicus rod-shaped virus 1]Q8QL31.1 RecName: Full=Uncharacterized protein 110 [Sulfolobus islandicus rod-shaped virus 1]CAC93979.1 hypothetical protein [Sulfolobus islandicus rod-shaped virus 1]CAG38843.1 hypothetical protein [Sulfolobus islandicus rudivirus 1 variant XX]